MTIQGELTGEDCRVAHRAALHPYMSMCYLVALIYAVLMYVRGLHSLASSVLLMGMVPSVFPLIRYVVIGRCSPATYAKHFVQPGSQKHSSRSDSPLGPREMTFKAEGISITGSGFSKHLKFDKDIRACKAYDEGLIVYAPRRYEVFPRRWFTPEQYAEFQGYLAKGTAWRGWINYLWRS
ncbi:hypothetical protein BH09VER1_BH09VER1_43770 [soil metagenome]